MPKRLIYEEDAIAKFEPWLKVEGYSEGELNMLKAVLYELRFLPSAQPEVIRCKDCENLQTDWKPQDSDGYYCAVMDRMMEEDGFCSHAERRQDGQ